MIEESKESQKISSEKQQKIPPIVVRSSTDAPGTIDIIIKAGDKKKKS